MGRTGTDNKKMSLLVKGTHATGDCEEASKRAHDDHVFCVLDQGRVLLVDAKEAFSALKVILVCVGDDHEGWWGPDRSSQPCCFTGGWIRRCHCADRLNIRATPHCRIGGRSVAQ